jgi:hypothetical protein
LILDALFKLLVYPRPTERLARLYGLYGVGYRFKEL